MSTQLEIKSLMPVSERSYLTKKTTLLRALSLGAALIFTGCEGPDTGASAGVPLDSEQQATTNVFNGSLFNGSLFNGSLFNGSLFNGSLFNGSLFNGSLFNGSLFNGSLFNGLGWNGVSWDGNIWGGGTGQAQDCTVTGTNPVCTAIHDAINHVDANGNSTGVAIAPNQTRLSNITALQEWVECACPAGFSVDFEDNHGLGKFTFYGALGLAKHWCSPTKAVQATDDEKISDIQIVSACLLARVNMKGKHYPLSLRSLEAGTAVTTNEGFLSNRYLATYGANLWKKAHVDDDKTTAADPNNLWSSGGEYWNMERFVTSGRVIQSANSQLANALSDQFALGRDCEQSNCGGHVEYLNCGGGDGRRKVLGNWGAWDPSNPNKGYYQASDTGACGIVPPPYFPAPAGYVTYNDGVNQGGGSTTESFTYRGNTYRSMEAWGPFPIPLEDPPSGTSGTGTRAWANLDSGAAPSSVVCGGGLKECDGYVGAQGKKLVGLTDSQYVSLNFSGNQSIQSNAFTGGSATEPNTLAIRYSRGTMLGQGQCDVDGCANTFYYECQGWNFNSATGCTSGIPSPGLLRIYRWSLGYFYYNGNLIPYSNWVQIHGNGGPYGKNLFQPTYSGAKYNTAYVYPVYMTDSGWTIPGSSNPNPGINTIRMRISGEVGDNGANSPELDTAYYFAGPPPGDATCTQGQACWLFVGPYQATGSLAAGQETSAYVSPFLPPGSYTFQITNVVNDADLYVKVSYPAAGQQPTPASLNNYTCRPYLGTGASEYCTVQVTGRGGYISAMVRGYSSTASSATLLGKN